MSTSQQTHTPTKTIHTSASVSQDRLIPITIIAGRGLIFDIEDVILLREKYHVCGVLGGVLPQFPQQNQFLGLPLVLMPEEVKYLVEEVGAGYLVDDPKAHEFAISTFGSDDQEQLQERLAKDYKAQNMEHKVQALMMRRQALEKKAAGKGQKKKQKGKTGDQNSKNSEKNQSTSDKKSTEESQSVSESTQKELKEPSNTISAEEQEFIEHGFKDLKITEEELKMINNIPSTAGRFYEIPTSTKEKPEYLPAYSFYQDQYQPQHAYDREAVIRQVNENYQELQGNSALEDEDNIEKPDSSSNVNSKAEGSTHENTLPKLSTLSSPHVIKPNQAGYEAFKYFHSQKGYHGENNKDAAVNFYLTPGLRFGGQYVAYPGDPLRYHSHHIVTGKEYNEKFKIMDIIGGGRLGTTVKKTWFVGAKNPENDKYNGFCVEWSTFG